MSIDNRPDPTRTAAPTYRSQRPRRLLSRRTVAACLVAAPLCEVVEGVLSPLTGQSTRSDLLAVQAHQTTFVVSVLVGLLGTVLYVPGLLGLAARTVTHSRRLSRLAAATCAVAMLGFAGVRMVSAVELVAVRRLPLAAAVDLVDGLSTNPLVVLPLVLFLGGALVGYPALAAASWRSGLPRVPAAVWGLFPFVTFFVDDSHVGNIVTHVVLLGSLGWIATGLPGDAPVGSLLGRRSVVALLLVAPLLELVELVLSPLPGTTSAADLSAIDAHQVLFLVSVLVGIAATVCYLPGLVGLAAHLTPTAPRTARVGAAGATLAMLGFMGVRVAQGAQLQLVRGDVPHAAAFSDTLTAQPIGIAMILLLIGASAVGMPALAVAAWRSRLPRPACVLVAAFPFVDLLAPGHLGTICSHVVLLAGLAWLAAGVAGSSRADVTTEPVASPA